MISWMLYAALTAVLIAAGALALERLVASTGRPRRFVWLAALGLAVVVPLFGGLREPPSSEVFPAESATAEAAARIEPARAENTPGFITLLPIPTSRTAARTAAIAWWVGSAMALAALCAALIVVAGARRRWPLCRVGGTDVYLSGRFGPALVGIVAPKPVIPAWVLTAEPSARTAILRHELEHARARDHLALLYAGLVVAAFPWSPAIWWMCRRLRAAIEIDCDRRVIAGGIGAAGYGAVLLQAGARSHGGWGFVPAMGQPRSLLERRLRTMMEKKLRLNAVHGALLAAAALVTLGIACEVPAPTQLNEAIDEVIAAEPDNLDTDIARLADPYLRIASAFQRGLPAGSPPPFVFLNDRLASGLAGASETTDSDLDASSEPAGPAHIMSVEILKYAAAQEFLGEEAPGGIIRIFTSGGKPVARSLNDSLERVLAEVESQAANPGVLGWSHYVTGYGSSERELDILSGRR